MSELDLDAAVAAARRVAEAAASDGTATRLRIRETLARRRGPGRRATIIAAVIASLFGSTAFAYFAGWRPPWSDPPPAAEPAPAAIAVPEPARRSRPGVAPIEDELASPAEPPMPRDPAPTRPAEALTPPAPPSAATAPTPRATPARARSTSIVPDESPPPAPRARVAPSLAGAPDGSPPAAPRAGVAPPAVGVPDGALPAAPRARVAPPAPSGPDEAPAIASRSPLAPSTVRAPGEPRLTAPPAPDPELAAYRIAHEAHFRAGDTAAALAAWDAYLAAFPRGKLVLDARYNRGLVLIKLKRFAEARTALRPFANAPAGAYRQAEAAKLLGALPR